MRRFLIGFAGAIAAILVLAWAVPMGEVVTLRTVDADGRPYESDLWIAELDGALLLRAGDPTAGWIERLRHHPTVELQRAGARRVYRAVPVDDAALRGALNEALAARYGLADRLVRRAVDVTASLPVRLEPVEDAHADAR